MTLSDFPSARPTLADLTEKLGDDFVAEDDGRVYHCPAHDDSKPSLRVSVSAESGRVLLKCRAGCSNTKVMEAVGMTISDLATMAAGEVDFAPATSVDRPADPAAVAALAVKLDRWEEQLVAARQTAQPGEPVPVLDYAERRFGIGPDEASRLGLGLATDLGGGPRLVVPFRDQQGVARGFQARALADDAAVRWLGPKSPDGAQWAKLAWFPGSSGWDEVLITEGPGDSLTAVALGYDTIGIRGASLVNNPNVVDQVAEWVGDRVAVIAGDGDQSGRSFSATLARGLVDRGARAKVLPVPDGLDLTDWRARDGDRFATEVVRAILEAEEETSLTAALQQRDPARYPRTDLGNAMFVRDFIAAKGSGVRYSPETGFYLLDGGVWRLDKLDRTRAYVQEAAVLVASIARQLQDNIVTEEDKKQAQAWTRWGTYSQSMNGISAALRELQALPDVACDVNDFDRHPDLLAARNGVINLRTGELQPHDADLLLTRRIEFDYDPSAKAPRWEAFLGQVFPGYPDLPAYLQRLYGYGITGSTAEQCFVVHYGTGANGKSVFTDTLTEVFRDLAVTTPFSTFEEKPSGGIPNDIAALKGARLVMASEGEQGRPMAEAILKRVTGRDLISARFMRREFFEFRPVFLLSLASNFLPSFRGQDEGLWRRVKLIPWERYFRPEERDHRLGEKLLAEAQGILAWAVRGAVQWHAGGLRDPETIRNSTKQYRETSDVLSGFFPGEYVQDDAGRVETQKLFRAFQAWAEEHNHGDLRRWSSRAFNGAMRERGLTIKRSNGTSYTYGIRRARQTDRVDDHTAPEVTEEAEIVRVASTPDVGGADLDSVL